MSGEIAFLRESHGHSRRAELVKITVFGGICEINWLDDARDSYQLFSFELTQVCHLE